LFARLQHLTRLGRSISRCAIDRARDEQILKQLAAIRIACMALESANLNTPTASEAALLSPVQLDF
jgi:hypothetical protein